MNPDFRRLIKNSFMRSLLLILLTLQLLLPELAGQGWNVPDDKKGRLSTFMFDDNTRKAGEKLYTINCMSCHGTPGKGNYLNLVPPPGDPATEKIQRNKDGEIFYKVTTGRGPMPSFKSIFSSTEIWNIISFIRSFNSSYKQQIMPVITSSAYPGAVIKLTLAYNNKDSTIILNASATKDNIIVPVTGAEVKLFVHRAFGLLPVDETKSTDKEGIALFKIPNKLPGDTSGNVRVSARFTNEEIFGAISKDTLLCAGNQTIPVSLVAQRAMWNNVRKAPIWIILAYSFGLLAAWGFIFYVLMKLRDIFIIGESVKDDFPEKEN
jgi:mono/diheme cytochrome c family protein